MNKSFKYKLEDKIEDIFEEWDLSNSCPLSVEQVKDLKKYFTRYLIQFLEENKEENEN